MNTPATSERALEAKLPHEKIGRGICSLLTNHALEQTFFADSSPTAHYVDSAAYFLRSCQPGSFDITESQAQEFMEAISAIEDYLKRLAEVEVGKIDAGTQREVIRQGEYLLEQLRRHFQQEVPSSQYWATRYMPGIGQVVVLTEKAIELMTGKSSPRVG